jgi:hypothetical protein
MLRSLALAVVTLAISACGDRDRPAGEIQGSRRSPDELTRQQASQDAVAKRLAGRGPQGRRPRSEAERGEPSRDTRAFGSGAPSAVGETGQILFGDLHVHTTYSIDAFIYSLPLFGAEGSHPLADACDFARYCSALDFFSINDHAEGLTPERWDRTLESIRQCNDVAGDVGDPDLVAFVGWEWTQAARTTEAHFGHKNVIYPGLDPARLPARPISSLPQGTMQRARAMGLVRGARGALSLFGQGEYADFLWLIERMAQVPECPGGVDTRELPRDCRENAATPEELFEKLGQWGLDALVIPHGLAWGLHAPPGATLANQLSRARHVPEQQRLLEVYSGHGNSEELRDLREFERGLNGVAVCREPTPDYLPCCWQAGEIVRARCGDLPGDECEARVVEARKLALEAGTSPHRVFPDASTEEWLDCGQCRDCFKPAYGLRPGQSAQYSLALGNFREPGADGEPQRFRWGFVASSDDHKAQPGTGYKQVNRKGFSDARGIRSASLDAWVGPWVSGDQEDPRRAQPAPGGERGFRDLFDSERVASFLYPGGLAAVHAEGRDRESIWRALQRRQVYGTSGPRILLWFDLLNAPGGASPMGSEVEMAATPRFQVRAAGAFVQQPGCPDERRRGLPAERLARLCRGECYHPGDARHPIVAVEVVRIRPQVRTGEEPTLLVEDPWRQLACDVEAQRQGRAQGCVATFEDPDYESSSRDAVYYVRAIQEQTPAINGANLRTQFDAQGRPVAIDPCYGSYKTPPDDDCLAPVHERAWSSPIYVDQPRESN